MPAKRGTGKQGRRSGPSHGRPLSRPPRKGAPTPKGRSDYHHGPRGQHARRRAGSLSIDGDVVEGKRAVAEALEAGVPIRRAFVVARPHGQDPTVARLVASLGERGVEVVEVSRANLDALSYHGTHQGIALETEPFAYADIHEVIEAAGTGDALVLCLDHVTDEGNLGAICRSAECAGAAGVVIPNRRAAAVGPGAYKTSAGALAHLKVARVPNMATAVEDLKRAGFWAVCATEHAEEGVWESDLSGRVCLVVGSEGQGVSRLVRERCDAECALPQMGSIESLNVAQAATVLAYEWLRQTLFAERDETLEAAILDDEEGGIDGDAVEATTAPDGLEPPGAAPVIIGWDDEPADGPAPAGAMDGGAGPVPAADPSGRAGADGTDSPESGSPGHEAGRTDTPSASSGGEGDG